MRNARLPWQLTSTLLTLMLTISACIPRSASKVNEYTGPTFTNPVTDTGADPWVVLHKGRYYRVFADGDSSIFITSFDRLENMRHEHVIKVWEGPKDKPYGQQTWAPEMHLLDGRWYIYFAASDGRNENHRMFALESETDDPLSRYHFKSALTPHTDRWAIDGTILEKDGRRYFVWSGWDDFINTQQNIYIAPMENPWTLARPGFVQRIEAERAQMVRTKTRTAPTASGRKAVNKIDYDDSSVEFKVDVPDAGLFLVDIHYANGTGGPSTHRLFVNGNFISDITYPNTTSYENWQTLHITSALNKGQNAIRLAKGVSYAEVDYIEVKPAGFDRVALTTPDAPWERLGGGAFVAEGPQILSRNGKFHIVYSASGSWSDDYTLGLLSLEGPDIMDPRSWVKKGQVFARTEHVFGPGHCSFTKSLDGKEDWIVYHAAVHQGAGWLRNLRVQRFEWDAQNNPIFGQPVPPGVPLPIPSAEAAKR